MGKGIKTRVAEKGIKAIDKAAVASERMKEAYIRTRDKADHSLYEMCIRDRHALLVFRHLTTSWCKRWCA